MASVPGPSVTPCYSIGKEEENFCRLCQLIMTICSDVFRDVLRYYIKPIDLRSVLDKNRQKLKTLKCINSHQLDILYPASGNTQTAVENMDMCLLYTLLRNVCNITQHTNKWGKHPTNGDNSLEACIERIRIKRNSIYGHLKTGSVDDVDFKNYWRELKNNIVEIEKKLLVGNSYELKVDELLSCALSSNAKQYVEEFKQLQTRIDDVERSTKRKIASKKARIDGVVRSTKRHIAVKKARVDVLEKNQMSITNDLKEYLRDMEQHMICVFQGRFTGMEQKLEGRLSVLNKNIEGRLIGMEQKMEGRIHVQVSALEENIKGRLYALEENMEGRFTGMEQKLEGEIHVQVSALEENIKGTLTRMEQKMEGTLSRMEQKMEEKFSKMEKKAQHGLDRLIFLPSAIPTLTIETPVNSMDRISYVKSGRLWIMSSGENAIFQVDNDGNKKEEVYSSGPFCVSKDNALLYKSDWFDIDEDELEDEDVDGDEYGNRIMRKTSLSTITLLKTEREEKVVGIYSSFVNGHILALIQIQAGNKITRYDENGLKIQDIWINDRIEGRMCWSNASITENRNRDIIIAGDKAVVGMDSSGGHRFMYSHPDDLIPKGICTDKYGHILVAFESSIHLLHEDGEFKKILLKNVSSNTLITCLCLDDEQNIYVGNDRGIVKVYKYLNDE